MFFCQLFLKSCFNTLMRDHLTPLDLPQAFFHFPYEPVVEIDELHDRGTRKGVRVYATLVSEARELGFHIER